MQLQSAAFLYRVSAVVSVLLKEYFLALLLLLVLDRTLS